MFSFTVLIEAISIRRIEPQSFWRGLYCSSGMYPVSCSSSNQYSASWHSLRAISNLDIKSFVPCAYCASCRLAPMDVPERKSWLVSTDSLQFALIYRQSRTISFAKAFALSLNTLSATVITSTTLYSDCKVVSSYIPALPELYFHYVKVILLLRSSYIIFASKTARRAI